MDKPLHKRLDEVLNKSSYKVIFNENDEPVGVTFSDDLDWLSIKHGIEFETQRVYHNAFNAKEMYPKLIN